jgi:peroxiredoxin
LFTRRKQNIAVPEVGAEAPEFNLPSAQGGQLRLSMRTVRGPVVVVFLRGAWSEEDVSYMKELAAKEDEINHSGASIVGIGVLEPDEAREFVRKSGIKSYVLYDYVKVTTHQWGLLEKDREHGEYARPAVFIVGSDHKVHNSWIGERPPVEEVMAKITEITGLPKPPVEPEEADGAEESAGKPKKMSAEERERVKAERRAAREAGESVKTPQQEPGKATAEGAEKPRKMSAEERERIKAERRAAREQGKSLKTGTAGSAATSEAAPETPSEASAETTADAPATDEKAPEKPKKMTAEERERIKAERRAAREAGRSLKQPTGQGAAETGGGDENASTSAEATEPPESGAGKPKEE